MRFLSELKSLVSTQLYFLWEFFFSFQWLCIYNNMFVFLTLIFNFVPANLKLAITMYRDDAMLWNWFDILSISNAEVCFSSSWYKYISIRCSVSLRVFLLFLYVLIKYLDYITDSSIPNKIDSFLYVAQSYFRCMSKIASPVVLFHFNYTFAKKKTDNCG